MVARWSGRKVAEARSYVAQITTWPTKCGKCKKPVQQSDAWVVGHIKSRGAYPELTWVPSNWQVEHKTCSDKSGQAGVIEKAKAEVLKGQFSPETGHRESPPLPLHTHPTDATADPVSVRAGLSWDELCQDPPSWLQPFLEVPEDAAPPLYVSGVHPEAVGSYGPMLIEWAEAFLSERGQKLTLRWWQRLAFVLQLQHRADGSLCWRVIIESGPRRIGKSVRLRVGTLWRLRHGPELFEPEQLCVHTGRDLAIVREVLRKAWPWADAQNGWASKRGMTEPEVSFNENNRWVARSKDSTAGYDCCLAHADEAWDILPSAIDDDLEPSMLERESPQLVLTSTAHRRATSLMRGRIADVLAADDGETMILLWGAPPGADISDPAVWRAASPYWSESRRKLMASKYEKAMAGQDDPEFDDVDPVRGFMSQYLNVWHLAETRKVGNPVVSEDDWKGLSAAAMDGVPDSVAVEAWWGSGVSVAAAWKPASGPVVVSVESFENLPAAAAHVEELSPRKPVLVGASLVEHAQWRDRRLRVKSMSTSTRTCIGDLTRFLAESKFIHDGSKVLEDQVLSLRVSPGVNGPRIRSTDRADAIKAAVWAVQEASLVKRGMVIPTRFKREPVGVAQT